MKGKTFAMIKPSCLAFAPEVEVEMKLSGLEIVDSKMVTLSTSQAEEFYAEHESKPFFCSLVTMLSSAPVMVYELEGYDAIRKWRDLIGPTNPSKGERSQLRRRYVNAEAYLAGSPDNGFHGSANPEDAERELGLMKKWGILE